METIVESKRDRFLRLAERRTSRALEAINKLSALSNTGNYAYELTDVETMISALRSQIDSVEALFVARLRKSETFKMR